MSGDLRPIRFGQDRLLMAHETRCRSVSPDLRRGLLFRARQNISSYKPRMQIRGLRAVGRDRLMMARGIRCHAVPPDLRRGLGWDTNTIAIRWNVSLRWSSA